MADFFGGLAGGIQTGMQFDLAKQDKELARQRAKREEMARLLNVQKETRGALDEALQVEDPKRRGMILDDIFRAYSEQAGQQVSPELINYLKKDPEGARAAMQNPELAELTLGQLFDRGGNPAFRAQVMLAAEKASRETAGRAALAGQPAEGEAPAAEPSPLVAPTVPLERHSQRIEQQIADIDRRIGVVGRAGNTQGVGILQQQRQELVNQLEALRANPALAEVTEGRQRLTAADAQGLRDDLARAGRRDLAGRVMTGMPRAAADALRAQVSSAEGGTAAESNRPRSAEGEPKALTTPEQQVQEAEIKETFAARAAAFEQAEREAGKLRERIRNEADGARASIQTFERVRGLINTVGETGPITGPLRLNIAKALEPVLGSERTNRLMKLSDMELLAQANTELALAGLKGLGGNDTERELLTMMQNNPGLLRTPQGNRLAVEWKLAWERRTVDRDTRAEDWIQRREAEGKAPSLRSKDAGGMTFNQRWNRYLEQYPAYVEVARSLGLDPVKFATQLGLDPAKAANLR